MFIKKAYDEAYLNLDKFPSNEEVIKFMEGMKWDTPSGEAKMALGNGHQAIQDQAIGKSKWNNDKKRVELVEIEYFKAKCVNPPEGIKSLDWIILSLIILISLVSLLTLSSLDFNNNNILQKHSYRIIFSFFIFFIVATINIKFWYKISYFFYGFVILLLLFVDSFGLVGKGAKRWLDIGLFNLQPSELMKVAVILALARYYQHIKTDEIDRIKNLVLPITLIILPFILVIKQPDLGTALFILLVAISILWLAGLKLKIFIFGTLSLLILAPLSISFLKPYQKERILTFLNPENDPTGAGYHVIQSKIAIGSGGLFGQGYMEGSQSNLSFLPEPHTDFVFTAFAEQFGFFW